MVLLIDFVKTHHAEMMLVLWTRYHSARGYNVVRSTGPSEPF